MLCCSLFFSISNSDDDAVGRGSSNQMHFAYTRNFEERNDVARAAVRAREGVKMEIFG